MTTTVVLSVDPGKKKVGWCLGLATPALAPEHAGTYIHASEGRKAQEGYRLATEVGLTLVGQHIRPVISAMRKKEPVARLLICMERMQIDGRTAGKEADLLDVALSGQAIASSAVSLPGFDSVWIWSPTPMEWKGQLPKKISHERSGRDLTAHLPYVDKLGHDALDAAALWLWAVRQLQSPVPFRAPADSLVLR